MPFVDQIPTLRRVGPIIGVFLWKGFCRLFFVAASFVTLIALFVVIENFRTQRAWDNYQQQAQAKGLDVPLSQLLPPPVPDDQNFISAPIMRLMYEPSGPKGKAVAAQKHRLWASLDLPSHIFGPKPFYADRNSGRRSDPKAWIAYINQPGVAAILKGYEAPLAEISAASRRPYSRFSTNYDKPRDLFREIDVVRELIDAYRLRIYAELGAGQSEAAAQDIITLLRVANAGREEPDLLSALTRVAGLNFALDALWQGLAARTWSDPQLADFQAELQKIDLFPQLGRGLLRERSYFARNMEQFRGLSYANRQEEWARAVMYKRVPGTAQYLALAPRFVYNQADLNYYHYYDQYVIPSVDVARRRVNPALLQAGDAEIARLAQPSLLNPASFLLKLSLDPEGNNLIRLIIRTQSDVDQAALACALERFRHAHGHYPDSLAALVPQFIAQLPHDLITGDPLHYSRTAGGSFLLYAVGWNATDDHGTVVKKSDGEIDWHQGDWVWPSPAP